jgi:FAD/FMN-containing dehydrogenase
VQTIIANYDGSITMMPKQVVRPTTVAEIQDVMRDTARFPSPVRAMGSCHSLTPCMATDGTIVEMKGMDKVLDIDEANKTITAQAGLQIVDASDALRDRALQLMTNIEIGNMTLGAAACCHSKDALDGIEFGQVGTYVTRVKWVTPTGELAEASESSDPQLLRNFRTSYGLAGIAYEVTLRIKPIEVVHFTYLPRPVDELTQAEVDDLLNSCEGLVCWTVGRTAVFQRRERIAEPRIVSSLFAAGRRRLWNHTGAHGARFIDQFITDDRLRTELQDNRIDISNLLYSTLRLFGGITLLAPDKTIDYSRTPQASRYAFSFWAFPRAQWLDTLRAYLDFADEHYRTTGFRCNMPLGAYYIRKDTAALLSYSHDGDIFSIDPIHASTDDTRWHQFMHRFNDFAYERNGVPLLNQSPFVQRKHVEAAYGSRWAEFSQWVRKVDPNGRMLNPFFAELLSPDTGPAATPQ